VTQDSRQFGMALLFALASAGLVIGGLSLSLAERYGPRGETSTASLQIVTQVETPTASSIPRVQTATAGATGIGTIAVGAACQYPVGWIQAVAQSGDTLASMAARYRSTTAALRVANCLLSEALVPGAVLYVPAVSANTITACTAGAAGWSRHYVVKAGDTMYRIATDHYTTVDRLKHVNCRTSDLIRSGELLWAPSVATRTPGMTLAPTLDSVTPNPTDPFTETPLPYTLTPLPFTASPSP